MFKFNEYFEKSNLASLPWGESGSVMNYAFMSAYVKTLKDLGVPAEAIFYGEGRNQSPMVKIGDKAYGYDEEINLIESDVDFRVVNAKYFYNAATWKGSNEKEFAKMERGARDLINKSLSLSIDAERGNNPAEGTSLESRLIRAQALGFDTSKVMYHETGAANELKILEEGFNLNIVNARSNDEVMPDGVFTKPDDNQIDVSNDPIQMAFFVKKGKYKTFESRHELRQELSKCPEWVNYAGEKEEISDHYDLESLKRFEQLKSVVDDHEKREVLHADYNEFLKEWRDAVNDVCEKARKAALNHLLSKGYDGIRVKKDLGSRERVVDTTIVFNPEHILSTSSNFSVTKRRDAEKNYGIEML